MLFTSLPVIVVAVLDQDLGQEYCVEHPEAYRVGIRGERFTRRLFWYNILDGVYQGTVCFLVAFAVFGWGMCARARAYPRKRCASLRPLTGRRHSRFHSRVRECAPTCSLDEASPSVTGRETSLYGIGMVICATVVVCAHVSLALQVRNWTWIMALAFLLSMALFFAFNIIAGSAIGATSFFTFDLTGVLDGQLGLPITWLTIALAAFLAVLPRLLTRYCLVQFRPIDSDVMREQEVVYGGSPPMAAH